MPLATDEQRFRDLLKKYMRHVVELEGTCYLNEWRLAAAGFTREEIDTLRQLEAELDEDNQ